MFQRYRIVYSIVMVTIFYDFETSSLSPVGHILSYCLMVIDESNGALLEECTGWVQPPQCELPDLDALLVTGIRLPTLTQQGLPEPAVAHRLYRFLASWIQKEGSVTLCGYNSNRFDLRFLRSLFIRHGLNPYFYGKLKYKDVLHYVKHLAMTYPDFPWQTQDDHWTFSLERMARAHGILHTPQSHDARADVALTIQLCQTLSNTYPLSFTAFQPLSLPAATVPLWITQHMGTPPHRYDWAYMAPVTWQKNTCVWVSVSSLSPPFPNTLEEWAPYLHALSLNTAWCHAFPAPPDAMAALAIPLHHLQSSPVIGQLSVEAYFSSRTDPSAPEQDIEYRLTRLPFDRIHTLYQAIHHLTQHWDDAVSYLSHLHHAHPDVARLALRYAMNHAPEPADPRLVRKRVAYLHYRHLSGEMDPRRTIDTLRHDVVRAQGLWCDPATPSAHRAVAHDYLTRVSELFPSGLDHVPFSRSLLDGP